MAGRALIGVVALGLLGAGMTGYLLGEKSATKTRAQTSALPSASIPQSDAEAERQRAWQQIAAAMARPADPGPAAAEHPDPQPSGIPAAEPNAAHPSVQEPPPMTALEERERAVTRLRESGPDQRNLIRPAQAVGNAWQELAKKRGSPAQAGPWECHAAGCAATLVHQSEEDIEDLTSEISLQDEFRSWEGPKMRSGPIKRPDGTTEVTWILYAGNEGASRTAPGR
jgi:hypothetical protein